MKKKMPISTYKNYKCKDTTKEKSKKPMKWMTDYNKKKDQEISN